MDIEQLYKAKHIAECNAQQAVSDGDNPEPCDIQTIAKCELLINIFNPRSELAFDDIIPF